ncbi:SDR family oxidoreductase [Pararhodobacter sp.]|uniref:SDR family oxidoreductase n=1 Tax=Pararhodobacter sp. TaxID=2127056 RepID=UPI002AFE880D|nr:SDR family oxidoreductase [Pararhodobacter sp.]
MDTILITGATSGIGRAMAVTLAGAGYGVLALGRNRAALEALSAEAPGVEGLALDLADRAGLTAALDGRRIDVLVNNAGMMPVPGAFASMDADAIDRTLALNLGHTLWLTRLLLPGMLARGTGHLVFTGSSAAHAPGAGFAAYAASKAGIAAFATALRAEVSPRGLRVTELVPGRVETGLYTGVLPEEARAAMYQDGNALQPQDVADMLLALIRLPARASVTRLDLMPTRPVSPVPLS